MPSLSTLTRIDRTLATLQSISGLSIATFSILHLFGHSLANVSFNLSDSAMYAFREYYQTPGVELVVVGGAVVVHVASSVGRIVVRRVRAGEMRKLGGVGKKEEAASAATVVPVTQSAAVKELGLHRKAGYVLAGLIGVHAYATRINPLIVLPDPSIVDLTLATESMIRYPGTFHIYYTILGAAGVYHTLYGIQQALLNLGVLRPSQRFKPGRWTKVSYVTLALMASTALAVGGAYETIPMPLAAKWELLNEALVSLAPFGMA
ncbi:hypothetical protein HK104_000380 [Borealophlyctis nickersoniae]|nr:hypothetical protein HK104_000380 [Borealophlyctis nickersoniae]